VKQVGNLIRSDSKPCLPGWVLTFIEETTPQSSKLHKGLSLTPVVGCSTRSFAGVAKPILLPGQHASSASPAALTCSIGVDQLLRCQGDDRVQGNTAIHGHHCGAAALGDDHCAATAAILLGHARDLNKQNNAASFKCPSIGQVAARQAYLSSVYCRLSHKTGIMHNL